MKLCFGLSSICYKNCVCVAQQCSFTKSGLDTIITKMLVYYTPQVIQHEKIKVRNTYEEIKNISFLYDNYTPKRWYFEMFDCVRRLSLGAIPVLIIRGE